MATWEILLHERPSLVVESKADLTAAWLKYSGTRRAKRFWAPTPGVAVIGALVVGVRKRLQRKERGRSKGRRIGFTAE